VLFRNATSSGSPSEERVGQRSPAQVCQLGPPSYQNRRYIFRNRLLSYSVLPRTYSTQHITHHLRPRSLTSLTTTTTTTTSTHKDIQIAKRRTALQGTRRIMLTIYNTCSLLRLRTGPLNGGLRGVSDFRAACYTRQNESSLHRSNCQLQKLKQKCRFWRFFLFKIKVDHITFEPFSKKKPAYDP